TKLPLKTGGGLEVYYGVDGQMYSEDGARLAPDEHLYDAVDNHDLGLVGSARKSSEFYSGGDFAPPKGAYLLEYILNIHRPDGREYSPDFAFELYFFNGLIYCRERNLSAPSNKVFQIGSYDGDTLRGDFDALRQLVKESSHPEAVIDDDVFSSLQDWVNHSDWPGIYEMRDRARQFSNFGSAIKNIIDAVPTNLKARKEIIEGIRQIVFSYDPNFDLRRAAAQVMAKYSVADVHLADQSGDEANVYDTTD
ncbi:hypothetical protein, partial [Pseudomonas khavaziana]|uniref:hypothetical protein n=1 Tax=Pseudomonas khavaziana TaxID=2842351 RepID=UPI001C3C3182